MHRGRITTGVRDRDTGCGPLQSTVPALGGWHESYLTSVGKPATAEESKWFSDNRGLFVKVGRKLVPFQLRRSCNDVLGFAFPPALKALRAHREDGGAKKTTLALRYVANELNNVRRSWRFFGTSRCGPRSRRLTEPLLFGGRSNVEIDAPPVPEDMTELLDRIAEAFRGLRKRHQDVLSLWLGLESEPRGIRDIARDWKVTKQRIQQLTAAALTELAVATGLPKPVSNRGRRSVMTKRKQKLLSLTSGG